MMSIYPDPEESKIRDSICIVIVLIIAFVVLLFTLPGCQADKQSYQPFVEPPAPDANPVGKIRPAIHEAAIRVDDVLEKTPVPAVTEVLVDDAMDLIEKIDPLPKTTASDPQVAEIIEPKIDPLFAAPDIETDNPPTDETSSGLGTWSVLIIGMIVLIYLAFKMLKGSSQDVKDSKR
ncbi:hypothetical protein [uncultured Gimesia sp.]|uniref:hypothetical protein n=1 Tax=uncultured Gimesia sp. TaxID=1678688 RepID=UPI0030DCFD4C|tara:strand:+ start:103083 stop:103613 length:531 start_codon:yes stop_codon:yes gene_type:complete